MPKNRARHAKTKSVIFLFFKRIKKERKSYLDHRQAPKRLPMRVWRHHLSRSRYRQPRYPPIPVTEERHRGRSQTQEPPHASPGSCQRLKVRPCRSHPCSRVATAAAAGDGSAGGAASVARAAPVSYTHLTLPTIYSV